MYVSTFDTDISINVATIPHKGVPLFTLKICHALSDLLRASSVLSEIDNHLFLLFVLIKIGVVDVQQPN